MTFSELASVVFPAVAGGVSLHHVLGFFTAKLAAKLSGVATAVETGNVSQLRHDAAGVVDFVQTHDPALAKLVQEKVTATEAAAAAEVEKVRAAASAELRKAADALAGLGSPAPVQAPTVTSPDPTPVAPVGS